MVQKQDWKNTFWDGQVLRESIANRNALQEMQKDILQAESKC